MLKDLEEQSITSINYAVTYYQTLEEVPWPLRKLTNDKKIQKTSKKLQVLKKKLLKLDIKNLKINP